MNKKISLLLILALTASSLTAVKGVSVESIPKPSAPEFTVKIVSYPYDVPPKTTTTIDQYTGKETTTTTPGYHVENKSIEVAIKNPQFAPIKITEYTPQSHYWYENVPTQIECNYTANLYYNVRVKGHFGNENDWKTPQALSDTGSFGSAQLGSKYTIFSCKADYSDDAQLDFQVQALMGFYLPYGRNIVIFGYDFYGQESGWSNTQTIAINESATTPTSNPLLSQNSTATPDQPTDQSQNSTSPSAEQPDSQNAVSSSLDWAQIATLTLLTVIAVILVIVIVFLRKRRTTK